MPIIIDQELCAGCGVCIDVCPVEAIYMVDQWPKVNEALCTQCEACIEACPNGAIRAIPVPAAPQPVAEMKETDPRVINISSPTPQSESSSLASKLAPLAATALGYVGREVLPRLADALVIALERRLTQSESTAQPLAVPPAAVSNTKTGAARSDFGFGRGEAGRGGWHRFFAAGNRTGNQPGCGQGLNGRGKGSGNEPGSGSAPHCICPGCGHKVVHIAGHRCIDRTCPKCGTKMIRE